MTGKHVPRHVGSVVYGSETWTVRAGEKSHDDGTGNE